MESVVYNVCSINSSIFKICQNDWISQDGLCYEDSCCMSLEASKTWHYQLSQISHISFSSIGIILVIVYFVKFYSRHILPFNIRVLLNLQLLTIMIHSIDMCIIHISNIYRSFKVSDSDPCAIRVRVDDCDPYRYIFSICVNILGFCQYGIYADRLICIYWKNYSKYHKYVVAIIVVQLLTTSIASIFWVYRTETSDSYLLSCLNVPSESVRDLTYITASIFPINIICFLISIYIFRIFSKRQKINRFEISRHFTASVDLESSEFLFRITAIQALFIVIYPICSLTMRYFYKYSPRPIILTAATLSYVFSIYSAVIPIVIVNYVKSAKKFRKKRIWSHVRLKSIGTEGADNYFNNLKSQW